MKYFCVELRYHCPRGHPNRANKVFSAPEDMAVGPELIQFHLTRHELVLDCCACPPGTFLRPKSNKEAKVSVWIREITPERFQALGVQAECLADS